MRCTNGSEPSSPISPGASCTKVMKSPARSLATNSAYASGNRHSKKVSGQRSGSGGNGTGGISCELGCVFLYPITPTTESTPEAALALIVRAQGAQEVDLAERGPVRVAEVVFGVGALPQHEARESHFATG